MVILILKSENIKADFTLRKSNTIVRYLDYDKKINIVGDSIQVLIEESDMHPNLKI